ncbi:MAG TPA: AAA family ATPase [Solirubrobacteraceae bacterium]|jgi:DNA-binding CsgD family transcriptional regulator
MDGGVLTEPAALLEREREVERVDVALRAVGRRAGGAIVIEGAAGMGKSRLLYEARARAEGFGVGVLSARGAELEQGFPFGVARQLFERRLLDADAGERDRWLAGAAALSADVLVGVPSSASGGPSSGPPAGDPGYAWQHGLYWLASNLAADSPLVLMVDDLQWCDAPSLRALSFIARRLDGQPLALILATRPLDSALAPVAATLVADPAAELLRLSPLTRAAVARLVAARLCAAPDDLFVRACVEATGGNPFLLGELLSEAAARGLDPTTAAAADVGALVPRGVANAVLLRLGRLGSAAATLARAVSVLGDDAQVGDAARLAGLTGADVEAAMAALVSGGVVEPGGAVCFVHPVLRAAIYGDVSSVERERLHQAAAAILRERAAPVGQVAVHVMNTERAGDPGAVALLRDAARDALALGDPAAAAALLARAIDEPPAQDDCDAILLELGQARARAGAPEAVAPLSEVIERARDPEAIAAAAIELIGMLFFAGRGADGAAILRRARERLPAGEPAREQLEAALLGVSYGSVSARRETDATFSELRDPGGPARNVLEATTLATLAMEEVAYLRPAAAAVDLAERALAAGLPLEPHRGENWALLALGALAFADGIDAALRRTDEILVRARKRGAALTVVTMSGLRAAIRVRRGDLAAAEADAQAAIELAADLLDTRFLALAVSAAVLAGLERDETPESLRLLIDRTGIRYDTEFIPNARLRYASGVLRAAAGNHEAAIEELRGCARDHPAFGSENPAMVPWRSAAAFSLAKLGRHDESRELAADEVRRAQTFGAPRAIGIALRAQALVGPPAERTHLLAQALEVLAPSPARLEHARVLVDLGATLRAAGQRTAAREPLLEALALAARCGALALQRRAKAELAAIGVRPRTTDHTGADSLTPSERRVVDLAATGGTNREIAQMLFVTEKTVETHLGRAFRKLDISSRRQLPDALASTAN